MFVKKLIILNSIWEVHLVFANLVLAASLPVEKVPNLFVVAMGVGTVFVGLICIVIICKIMSALCGAKKKNTEEVANSAVAPVQNQVIENRQEIIAAVSAAVAEDMGTDISGIRILSFKKL